MLKHGLKKTENEGLNNSIKTSQARDRRSRFKPVHSSGLGW